MLVAIQQLRDQAVATGVLATTEKVSVVTENSNVVIKSADPEVVYVPQYEPQMLYDPGYVAAPIVYSDPYPSYYYPAAPYFTGFVTGAVFAAAVDWDDWGAWGGDVDVDIKVDGDKVKIDYKGGDKVNIKGGDKVNNIDRDKLKNVDRSKVEIGNKNIDQTKLKQELKNNSGNRVNNKVATRPVDKSGAAAKKVSGQDVRKNVQTGLKDGPKPAARPATGAKPAARPATGAKPAAKPANRPATVNKKPSGPKPGARPDTRPSKPSAFGDPGKGKPANLNSNRGNSSRGGGISGGRPKSGGVKRPPSRGGGGGGGGGRRR